jgi:hypothetical protein
MPPGFYYEKLDEAGRVMVIEVFRGWTHPDKPDIPVNGFYKKILNSEEDAVNYLIERGCPYRTPQVEECSPSQVAPSTQQEPQAGLERHTVHLPMLKEVGALHEPPALA